MYKAETVKPRLQPLESESTVVMPLESLIHAYLNHDDSTKVGVPASLVPAEVSGYNRSPKRVLDMLVSMRTRVR